MALTWSEKRKLVYFLVVFFLVAIPTGVLLALRLYEPPTCFDKEQNQGEEGVDCGGPCALFCTEGNSSLTVLWDRSIQLGNGMYNAVAYIENTLDGAGIEKVLYTFSLYDAENMLITKRSGTTFVNPGEGFAIFEPRIATNYHVPVRTFLSFEIDPVWTRTTEESPKIVVKDRKISDLDSKPRLVATLENPQLVKVENIDVTAIVYDTEENVIGVSGTFIESFARTSTRQVSFTWSKPFTGKVSQIEIIPRVSVFQWEDPLK